ncbi:MAG: hypothetical protein M9890_07975 [Thermomicrobiales bacterium]|nr:hypothetical protein [Thermomicrobiales bacterium]
MRFPFIVTEEILAFGNRPSQPQNACIELRVSGTIDEDRLRDAVVRATGIHPMARAARVARRRRLSPPMWEVQESGSLDISHVIRVAEADGEDDMQRLRGEFTSELIDLERPPAVRLLIVRRVGGDSLLYIWHHAMADGMGGIRFLRSIVRAYADQSDPIPDVDPIDARILRTDGDPSELDSDSSASPPRTRDIPSLVLSNGAHDEPGYGMCYEAIELDDIDLHDYDGLEHRVTVNDILLAALHLTIDEWNRLHGGSTGKLIVLTPISLRPPEWMHEVVANVVGHGVIVTTADQRADRHALLATTTQQTRHMRTHAAAAFKSRPDWVRQFDPLLIFIFTRRPFRRRREAAALISNVGRLRGFEEFGSAGDVVELWGSTPASMPPGLGIGIVRWKDRLHISIRYRHALFDAAAAARFLRLFADQTRALGTPEQCLDATKLVASHGSTAGHLST